MEKINLYGNTTGEKLVKLETAVNDLYSQLAKLGVYVSKEPYGNGAAIYSTAQLTQSVEGVTQDDFNGRLVYFIPDSYVAYVATSNMSAGTYTVAGGELIRGADGINGVNGTDGKDGRDGADGTNGKDGCCAVLDEIQYLEKDRTPPFQLDNIPKLDIVPSDKFALGMPVIVIFESAAEVNPKAQYIALYRLSAFSGANPVTLTLTASTGNIVGARGLTGNGISHCTTGTPYISGENTITPFNVEYSDGTAQELAITAKNGESMPVIEISGNSGTFTDDQYNILRAGTAIIKKDGALYFCVSSGTSLIYESVDVQADNFIYGQKINIAVGETPSWTYTSYYVSIAKTYRHYVRFTLQGAEYSCEILNSKSAEFTTFTLRDFLGSGVNAYTPVSFRSVEASLSVSIFPVAISKGKLIAYTIVDGGMQMLTSTVSVSANLVLVSDTVKEI